MKYFAMAAALVAALGTTAQAATGMSQMQYYVGSWSCMAGDVGHKPSKATGTFTMDGPILRLLVVVPVQPGVKHQYTFSQDTVYDAKNNRFVQSDIDSDAAWSISTGTVNGNSESWKDTANPTGKLSKSTGMRNGERAFSFETYPTTSSTKPTFKVSCTKT